MVILWSLPITVIAVLCTCCIQALIFLTSDRIKIYSLVKSFGGRVIKIKKLNREIRFYLGGRRARNRYPRYYVIYQTENQKIECIADLEKSMVGNINRMRLFNKSTINHENSKTT